MSLRYINFVKRVYEIFFYNFLLYSKYKGQAYNFDKYTYQVDFQGFAYDYYSLMHYEYNAFSMNGQATIVAKQPGITLLPAWQKYSLTATDVAEIRKRYQCV